MSAALRLPDGTAVLGGVEVRLTDERAWETESLFVASAEELRSAIRSSWDARIRDVVAGRTPARRVGPRDWRAGIPAGRVRTHHLAEAEAWLAERMSRPDSTEEQRRSWQAQAAYWRYVIREETGGGDWTNSILRLHVRGPVSDLWLSPGPGLRPSSALAPRVPRNETLDRCDRLLRACVAMAEHDVNMEALCGFAFNVVYPRRKGRRAP